MENALTDNVFDVLRYRHYCNYGQYINGVYIPPGSIYWLNESGQLHRENGPAREDADGTKFWFRNGFLHREDGPAFEHADGTKVWYTDGDLHRDDGPAIEHVDGTKEWWIDGKCIMYKERVT